LSTTEAAQYLGVDPRTLRRLVNDDQLQAFRIGRLVRFRLEDLDDYLDRARITPGSFQ
jgi:excisionase family DNA binding protein